MLVRAFVTAVDRKRRISEESEFHCVESGKERDIRTKENKKCVCVCGGGGALFYYKINKINTPMYCFRYISERYVWRGVKAEVERH